MVNDCRVSVSKMIGACVVDSSQQQESCAQRALIDALRVERDDLQVMLETAVAHGDAVEAQLSKVNSQLVREIRERRQAEARLESVISSLREKINDFELVVEILAEHSDALDAGDAGQQSGLEEQVVTDSLTGLANHRALDRALEQHWGDRHAHFAGLSLLLIEVDFFKLYNDSQGYPAGDECLQRVAQCMSDALSRPGGIIARNDGEAFCVILPDTDEDGALRVARSLMAAVNALRIAHPQSPHGRVTISVGGTTYRRQHDEADLTCVQDLQARAEAALYVARQRGRNRFCMYERNQ